MYYPGDGVFNFGTACLHFCLGRIVTVMLRNPGRTVQWWPFQVNSTVFLLNIKCRFVVHRVIIVVISESPQSKKKWADMMGRERRRVCCLFSSSLSLAKSALSLSHSHQTGWKIQTGRNRERRERYTFDEFDALLEAVLTLSSRSGATGQRETTADYRETESHTLPSESEEFCTDKKKREKTKDSTNNGEGVGTRQ